MVCGCCINSTTCCREDNPAHFVSAVTALQVTFINNVKKAREALAGLMDVSNLERCVFITCVSGRRTLKHVFSAGQQ